MVPTKLSNLISRRSFVMKSTRVTTLSAIGRIPRDKPRLAYVLPRSMDEGREASPPLRLSSWANFRLWSADKAEDIEDSNTLFYMVN